MTERNPRGMTVSQVLTTLQTGGITLSANGDRLHIEADSEPGADTLELIREHKAALLQHLSERTIPPLPWQLESLVRAASSGVLPTGTVQLPTGAVNDLSGYVLAWAAAYLTGDREHCLERLWDAYLTGDKALFYTSTAVRA